MSLLRPNLSAFQSSLLSLPPTLAEVGARSRQNRVPTSSKKASAPRTRPLPDLLGVSLSGLGVGAGRVPIVNLTDGKWPLVCGYVRFRSIPQR